jgi:hypothetical protein
VQKYALVDGYGCVHFGGIIFGEEVGSLFLSENFLS